MRISIVTPSYNMLAYLKRARASVADQQGVEVEHIIADGSSTDGTVEWLASRATPIDERPPTGSCLRYFSGRDAGMYDALNKGFAHATGDVVAWLNCDEQYLEGALAFVRDTFAARQDMDILFGAALLVDPENRLLALRKPYPARHAYVATAHLYNLSCATFFRGRLWRDGLHFDTRFRYLGDHDLILRALKAGARTGLVTRPLAAFAFTGGNLSWTEGAQREARQLHQEAPLWARWLRMPLNAMRVAEKFLRGAYSGGPVAYALHTGEGTGARSAYQVGHASTKWPDTK